LWGKHFWSPSYFAASCGGAPLTVIKHYIQQHNQPAQSRPAPPRRTNGIGLLPAVNGRACTLNGLVKTRQDFETRIFRTAAVVA
jgi:putative transposase